jgi:hypothetical protein
MWLVFWSIVGVVCLLALCYDRRHVSLNKHDQHASSQWNSRERLYTRAQEQVEDSEVRSFPKAVDDPYHMDSHATYFRRRDNDVV